MQHMRLRLAAPVAETGPGQHGFQLRGRGEAVHVHVVIHCPPGFAQLVETADRKSTRLNSSHVKNSYAVFCLKKKITYRSRVNMNINNGYAYFNTPSSLQSS